MLRQTKTTLKELTAQYRGVLRHAFLTSVAVMGVVAAMPANAAINVDVNDVLTNIEPQVQNSAVIAAAGSSTVMNAAVAAVNASITDTNYSDGKYDATAAYRIDEQSELSVTAGAPTQAEYAFDFGGTQTTINGNGDGTNMNKSLVAISSYGDLKTATDGTLTGANDYSTAHVARNNAQLYTQATGGYKFQMGATAGDDPTVAAALAGDNYTFASTKAGGDVSLKDVTNTELTNGLLDANANLAYTGYSWTDWNSVSHALNGDGLDWTVYTFTNTNGEADNLGNYVSEGVLNLPVSEFDNAATAVSHYNTDKTNYDAEMAVWGGDNTNYQAAVAQYNTERGAFNSLVDAYNTYDADYTTAASDYATANADYQNAYAAFTADSGEYATTLGAYNTYNASTKKAVDGEVDAALARSMADGGALDTALDAKADASSVYTKTEIDGKLGSADFSDMGATVSDALVAVRDVIGDPDEVEAIGGTGATVSGVLTSLDTAVDKLNGDKTVNGSVDQKVDALRQEAVATFNAKQTWVDNTLGIVSANADAVKTALTGPNAGEETTFSGAINAVDNAIGNRSSLSGENLVTDGTVVANLQKLNTAIGNRSALTGNYVDGTNDVVQNLQSLNNGIQANADAIGDMSTVTGTNLATPVSPATTATVAAHLNSLNSAIGNRGNMAGTYTTTGDIATNIKALDTQVTTNTNDIGAVHSMTNANGNLAVSTASVAGHLDSLDVAIGNVAGLTGNNLAAATSTTTPSVADHLTTLNASLDTEVANRVAGDELTLKQAMGYTDKLEENVSAGVASAVALSSVAVSNVKRGEVSVGGGYGYYNDQSAVALGAAMGLSDRWSVNAGAGLGLKGSDNFSVRAGTNYKFKLF